MEKKSPVLDFAEIFNRRLERLMPLLTPLGVFMGFALPGVFLAFRPFIPWLFGAMTLSGALKLKAREFARSLKTPLPILLSFISAHVILPLLSFLIPSLVFPGKTEIVAGYLLLSAAPTAVSSFIWVSIYGGDRALCLAIILIDTILAPFVVPATMSALMGTRVVLDMTGIAVSLILMVLLPTIFGISLNEASRGRAPAVLGPVLNPIAKLCLVLVIAANSAAVAPQLHVFDPQLWLIGSICILISALGYLLSRFTAAAGRLGEAGSVTVFFNVGLRNISAASTIAIEFFPAAAALPCLLGIVVQQTMAALMSRIMCPSGSRALPSGKA
ncbi:MAG: bile acid:sodium symporter family protein [Treponema sp.]|jgi:predicted Na+-dependent transporter|nr:bile acid:sodium symporter family protein [Treponema sp.]